MSDVVITKATSDDFDELVAAHAIVFAGTMGVALGKPYRRAFIGRFIREPEQIALVARRESLLVGYVLGRSISTPDNDRATTVAAAIGIALRPWLLLRTGVRRQVLAKARRRRTEPVEGNPLLAKVEGDLVGIGCIPAERGKGTAKALVQAFVAACTEMGWKHISLTVYRDNPAARALYRSIGFVEIDHPTNPDVVYEVLET